jgi:beta-galactosidase
MLSFTILSVLLPTLIFGQQSPDHPFEPDFFPFSVWYSGGDTRAPMLSEITQESREEWRIGRN